MVDWHVTAVLRRNIFVSFVVNDSKSGRSQLTMDRYVAMHAMQEDSGVHSHDHSSGMNGYSDGSPAHQRKSKGPQMRDTLATVAGMMIPLLAQMGH